MISVPLVHPVLFRRYGAGAALMAVAACGSSPAETPDGGDLPPVDAAPRDAAPGGTLERLGWSTVRDEPFATGVAEVPTAELFALSDDAVVTRSACDPSQRCTYTWHEPSGAVVTARDHMTPVTSTSLSPDGRQTLLLAADGPVTPCATPDGTFAVSSGRLQLLDAATGAVSFERALRTNHWSTPGFTPDNRWWYSAPLGAGACSTPDSELRAASAPFAAAPAFGPGMELVQELDPARWLVIRNAAFGVLDPASPGSFRSLGEVPDQFDVAGGWLHSYLGFGELVQEVVSMAPDGALHNTMLRDEDWFAFGASGRWLRVCQQLALAGYRDCRAVDVEGEHAGVDFRVTMTPSRPDNAVLLAGGPMVFVGPLDDGTLAVQRLDPASGRREVLHPGDGELRPLGDGSAALLVQAGSAWLIEADREELVAEQVTHVLTEPRFQFLQREPGRLAELVVLVRAPTGDARRTLDLLDVRTHRLATLTDRLYFRPHGTGGAVPDHACSQPWTTRHGGGLVDAAFQTPDDLFFVEEGAPAAIFLVPADLSSPPRRLAELDDPEACQAPLVSPGGGRIAVAEDGDGTTRITLSPPP